MPTYEYTCKSCGANFEVFIKSSEKGSVSCPGCEGKELREIYKINTTRSSSAETVCDACPSQKQGFG